ncbi:hypothetical protein M1307_00440 [Patescibacteria group bacterium]|nr:hypothetical protein [Patescibacteria group bacterium]
MALEAKERELTIKSSPNKLDSGTIFMAEQTVTHQPKINPEQATAARSEAVGRLVLGEKKTDENSPASVLAKKAKEAREREGAEAGLRAITESDEGAPEPFKPSVDKAKARRFVEGSFRGKYDSESGEIKRDDKEDEAYKKVTKAKGELEAVIEGYDKIPEQKKILIRERVRESMIKDPRAKAVIDVCPTRHLDALLDEYIKGSVAEMAAAHSRIYGGEPITNNIEINQAKLNGLIEQLKAKKDELGKLQNTPNQPKSTSTQGGASQVESDDLPKTSDQVKIPETQEELDELEEEFKLAKEDVTTWSNLVEKGRGSESLQDKLNGAIARRDGLLSRIHAGRRKFGGEQASGETKEQKISRLQKEILKLEYEDIPIAKADAELAGIDREEFLGEIVEASEGALADAVMARFKREASEADGRIMAEIEKIKNDQTSEEGKKAVGNVENHFKSLAPKRTFKARRFFSPKVTDEYPPGHKAILNRDAQVMVEHGIDVLTAALMEGVDWEKTNLEEKVKELTDPSKKDPNITRAQEILSSLKPEEVARLNDSVQGRLMDQIIIANGGSVPKGMESYLLNSPEGQQLVEKGAEKKGLVKEKIWPFLKKLKGVKLNHFLTFLLIAGIGIGSEAFKSNVMS